MDFLQENTTNIADVIQSTMTPAVVEGERVFGLNRIDVALTNKCQIALFYELARVELLSKKCKAYELSRAKYASDEKVVVEELRKHEETALKEAALAESATSGLLVYNRKTTDAISALAAKIATRTDELEHGLAGVVSFVGAKKTADDRTAELHFNIVCESIAATHTKAVLSRMSHLETNSPEMENKQASVMRTRRVVGGDPDPDPEGGDGDGDNDDDDDDDDDDDNDNVEGLLHGMGLGEFTGTINVNRASSPISVPVSRTRRFEAEMSNTLLDLYTDAGIVKSHCDASLTTTGDESVNHKCQTTMGELSLVMTHTQDHYGLKSARAKKNILKKAVTAFIQSTDLMGKYLSYHYRKGDRFVERKLANKELDDTDGDKVTDLQFQKRLSDEKEYMWFCDLKNEQLPTYFTSNEARRYLAFAKGKADEHKTLITQEKVDFFARDRARDTQKAAEKKWTELGENPTAKSEYSMFVTNSASIDNMSEADVEYGLLMVSRLFDFQRLAYRDNFDWLYYALLKPVLIGGGSSLHYSDSDYYGVTAIQAYGATMTFTLAVISSKQSVALVKTMAAWATDLIKSMLYFDTASADASASKAAAALPSWLPSGENVQYISNAVLYTAAGLGGIYVIVKFALQVIGNFGKKDVEYSLEMSPLGPMYRFTKTIFNYLIAFVHNIVALATQYALPFAPIGGIIMMLSASGARENAPLVAASIAGVTLANFLVKFGFDNLNKNAKYRSVTGNVSKVIRTLISPLSWLLDKLSPIDKGHHLLSLRRSLLKFTDFDSWLRFGASLLPLSILHYGSVTKFYEQTAKKETPSVLTSSTPFASFPTSAKLVDPAVLRRTEVDWYHKLLLATKDPWLYLVETFQIYGFAWSDIGTAFLGALVNRIAGSFLPLLFEPYLSIQPQANISAKHEWKGDTLQQVMESNEFVYDKKDARGMTFEGFMWHVKNGKIPDVSQILACNGTVPGQDAAAEINKMVGVVKTKLQTAGLLEPLLTHVGCTEEYTDKVLQWAIYFFPNDVNEMLTTSKIDSFPSAAKFTEPFLLHSNTRIDKVLAVIYDYLRPLTEVAEFDKYQKLAACNNPFAMLVHKADVENSYKYYNKAMEGNEKYTTTADAVGKLASYINDPKNKEQIANLHINYTTTSIFGEVVASESAKASSSSSIFNATSFDVVMKNCLVAVNFISGFVTNYTATENVESSHCHGGHSRSYHVRGAHGKNRTNAEEVNPGRDLTKCDTEILLFQEDHIALPVVYMQQAVFRNALKALLRDLSVRVYDGKFNETALRNLTLADITNAAESVPARPDEQRPIGSVAEEIFTIATSNYCSKNACPEEEEAEEEREDKNGEVCVYIGKFPLWNNGLQRISAFPEVPGRDRGKVAQDTFESVFYFLLLELVVTYSRARSLARSQETTTST